MFSMAPVGDTPLFPPLVALVLFVANVVLFERLCRVFYARPRAASPAGYFAVEKVLLICALLFFVGGAVYLCDIKYYLSLLFAGERFSGLVNIAGLLVFLGYLSLLWQRGRDRYALAFGRQYQGWTFVVHNLKSNLPIVLPWIVLSLVYDLLSFVPFAGVKSLLDSQWSELVSFLFFLFFIVVFFPPLVRRLWGCILLPPGPLLDRLVVFAQSQKFSAAFYAWPLFEGRMLTAAVMGILPGLRYILLTPGLLALLTIEEVVAVVAHEIGHVKRRHLLLYALLLGSFVCCVEYIFEPVLTFFLGTELPLIVLRIFKGLSPDGVFGVLTGAPLLVVMVLYFRFVFGYFMRNFERQADLYAVVATGSGRPLISAFEKIAQMSGTLRSKKNWHHFGIGERIACIERVQQDPEIITRHDRKVRNSLLLYLLFLVAGCFWGQSFATEELELRYEQRYAEAVLLDKIRQEPDQALWQHVFADLMLSQGVEEEALHAYEKAHMLDPEDLGIRNNWAWLLVTSRNLQLRDPEKSLALLRDIPESRRDGPILDTLATAYWANGFVEKAVELERQAALADPGRAAWYQLRGHGFLQNSYEQGLLRHQVARKK